MKLSPPPVASLSVSHSIATGDNVLESDALSTHYSLILQEKKVVKMVKKKLK